MPIPSGKSENGCPTLSDNFGLFSEESDAVELLFTIEVVPIAIDLSLASGCTLEGTRPCTVGRIAVVFALSA
jgi:hypothetical protein